MEYGNLIGRAWRLTWRHRFLWVLGLFATGSAGSCSPGFGSGGQGVQWRAEPEDLGQISPELERAVGDLGFWFSQNLWLVALVAGVAFLLGLAFMVVSLVAQGGMAVATAELAMGRPISAGEAWRAGLRLFWRYLGLWLLLIGIAILAAMVVGAVAVAGFLAAGAAGDSPRVVLMVLGGLLALLLALAAIPIFIAASIVVAFAQRAIAVENVGPLAALRAGVGLVRRQLGSSLLVWLINLALSFAAGLAVVLGVVAVLVPLVALAVVLYVITDLSPTLAVYGVSAMLVLVAVGWLLSGIASSFFWNYWTMAYLNFTGRLNERLEPPEG